MTESISIDQKLFEINKRILKNEFIPCLTELTQLSIQNITNPKIWMLIGFVYTRMGIWSSAISALETAIKLKPDYSNAEHLLSLALFSMGRREEACALSDKVVKKESTSANWMLRAYLHSHSYSDPQRTLDTAKDWGKRFADPLTRKASPIFVKDRSPNKKLKVGYVTADFREHSVAFFMRPILENHDHENFEIHVFSNGPEDATSNYFKTLVPYWLNVMDIGDDELCKKIRDLEIDVLVDLSGFTHGQRLGVFARRAAPVQVTYLGYLNTLGMKAMDYRLTARDMVSEDYEKFYSEKIYFMKCSSCYSPPAYTPLSLMPPAIRNGYPTLVSLNSSAKITDDILRLWAEILNRREDSRIIIMMKESDPDAAQTAMLPRAKAAGMPLDRVSVVAQQPLSRFMEMGHVADLMLDTSPISAGTTALHSLWMGLQIVTFDAERGIDASGARTIQKIGTGGVIVNSDAEYINAAIDLMADVDRMQDHRENIRGVMLNSPYMDYEGAAKDIESAFREMWLRSIAI